MGLNSWQYTFRHLCESFSPPLLDIKYLSQNRTGAGLGIGNLLLITVRGAGNGLLRIYHVYTRSRVSQVQGETLRGKLFLDSDFILRHRTATEFLERLVGGFLEIDFIVSWQFKDKEWIPYERAKDLGKHS